MKKWLLAGIVLLAVAAVTGYYWRLAQSREYHRRAVAALAENNPQLARVFSEKSLRIQPGHSPYLLTYAEAVFKDETLNTQKRIQLAMESLKKIGDQSLESYEARMHEASILFFNQLMPSRAEAALKRAIRISPERIEALDSLFQIYCCTGRETFTEPLFLEMANQVFDPDAKLLVMTNWFLSQFDLGTYNQRTDTQLGVDSMLGGNIPVTQKRLLVFRDTEPESLSHRVALANWFLLRTDGKQAKKLLDEMDPEKINPTDAAYLITAVNTYLEVGEIELAKELHAFWEEKSHYEYWRQKAVIEQDYDRKFGEAIFSLERALTIWPGQVDPSIYFRLETCLKKTGRLDDARLIQKKAEQIRQAVDVKTIKELRDVILTASFTASNCRKFSDFYRALGREVETESWEKLALTMD